MVTTHDAVPRNPTACVEARDRRLMMDECRCEGRGFIVVEDGGRAVCPCLTGGEEDRTLAFLMIAEELRLGQAERERRHEELLSAIRRLGDTI